MSDTENDLFGDENTSPAPEAAPSPSGAPSPGGGSSPRRSPSRSRSRSRSPRRRVDPDEEEEEEAGKDLFGDSDNEAPPRDARSPSTRASTPDSARRLEYGENEEDMVETSEVVADVLVPTWPRMTATDGKVWHVKLPAYVNVDPRPYDEEYYRQTNNDRDVPTGPAAKGKMIGVRNTLRWKWGKNADGEVERQSNARMVRWSDGSVSLQLGSDVFDLAPSYGATLARKQDESEDKKGAATPSAGRETTFVCVTAPNEQVLVTETSIAGQLSIVPTSMDSKTHRELVKHVGSQHEKQSRMMILDDLADHKKVQELLLRAAPQRQVAPKPSSRRSGARSTGDEFGSRRSRNFRRAASGDSEEEYETRRAREREYDEDDGFVVADSDEENEFKSKKRSKKSKKSSKRRHADYDDTEDEDEDDLDAMELADRRIEEAERDRKRSKKDSKKKSKDYLTSEEEDEDEPEDADRDDDDEDDADGDMDVESEEE